MLNGPSNAWKQYEFDTFRGNFFFFLVKVKLFAKYVKFSYLTVALAFDSSEAVAAPPVTRVRPHFAWQNSTLMLRQKEGGAVKQHRHWASK